MRVPREVAWGCMGRAHGQGAKDCEGMIRTLFLCISGECLTKTGISCGIHKHHDSKSGWENKGISSGTCDIGGVRQGIVMRKNEADPTDQQ